MGFLLYTSFDKCNLDESETVATLNFSYQEERLINADKI